MDEPAPLVLTMLKRRYTLLRKTYLMKVLEKVILARTGLGCLLNLSPFNHDTKTADITNSEQVPLGSQF